MVKILRSISISSELEPSQTLTIGRNHGNMSARVRNDRFSSGMYRGINTIRKLWSTCYDLYSSKRTCRNNFS